MASAQIDYTPLVREGVRWVYLERNIADISGESDFRYYSIEFRGDTVVEGRIYKKCYQYAEKENTWSSLYSSKDEPFVLMREEGHQVRLNYYKDIDTPYYPAWPAGDDREKGEIILYDFDNPQEGFVFDGYVNIDGREVKKFSRGDAMSIIEGIGFVSANMGDMISIGWYTPGVERIEMGLSHVEDESGRILYKGPNYVDGLPFAEKGKIWHMMREYPDYVEDRDDVYFYDYFIEGDTLIAGLPCKKLYAYNEDNNGEVTYKMSIYEEGGKVFFIMPGSEEKHVLYDFSGAAGDKVTVAGVVSENPWNVEMKVNRVRTFNAHGFSRGACQMARMNGNSVGPSGWWIEGVGSELGPFNTWNFGVELNKMSDFFLGCAVNGLTIFNPDQDMSQLYNTSDFVVDGNSYYINEDGSVSLRAFVGNPDTLECFVIPDVVEYQGKAYPVKDLDLYDGFIGIDLDEIYVGRNMQFMASDAFYGNTVKRVVWNARNCESLPVVTSGVPSKKVARHDLWVDNCGFGGIQTDKLEEVIIGYGVEGLPEGFVPESRIKSLNIPATVKAIGNYAFYNCTELEEIDCHVANPADVELGGCVFEGVPVNTCVLYVPKGSADLYRNADQWKRFKNIVEHDYLSNYTPLLREGVKWVYAEEYTGYTKDATMDNMDVETKERLYTIEVKGDTVIDGVAYKKVYRHTDVQWDNDDTPDCNGTHPVACLREEGRTVYARVLNDRYSEISPYFNYLKDETRQGREAILYDFQERENRFFKHFRTVQVGRSIKDSYILFWPIDPVHEMGTIVVEGLGVIEPAGDLVMIDYQECKTGYPNDFVHLHHLEDADGNIIYKGVAYKEEKSCDVNGDGKTDIEDVNAIINVILELNKDGGSPDYADVTGDGKVDIEDVNAVINYILGL